jgi:hypothetical protein
MKGIWKRTLEKIKDTITPGLTKTRWDYYGDNMGLNQIFLRGHKSSINS